MMTPRTARAVRIGTTALTVMAATATICGMAVPEAATIGCGNEGQRGW